MRNAHSRNTDLVQTNIDAFDLVNLTLPVGELCHDIHHVFVGQRQEAVAVWYFLVQFTTTTS